MPRRPRRRRREPRARRVGRPRRATPSRGAARAARAASPRGRRSSRGTSRRGRPSPRSARRRRPPAPAGPTGAAARSCCAWVALPCPLPRLPVARGRVLRQRGARHARHLRSAVGVVVGDAVVFRVAVLLGGLVGALGLAAAAREHHDAVRLARGASVRPSARAAIERSRRSTAPPRDATDRCAGVLLQRRVARRRRAPPLEGQPLELAARRRRHAARRETRCASSTTPSKGATTLQNTAQTREPTWRSHAQAATIV